MCSQGFENFFWIMEIKYLNMLPHMTPKIRYDRKLLYFLPSFKYTPMVLKICGVVEGVESSPILISIDKKWASRKLNEGQDKIYQIVGK